MIWLPCLHRTLSLGARSISSAASAVILRPYQESCLQACIDALDAGASRIGVSLPTGAGKTTVFVSLLSRLSPPSQNSRATRSLIVVNNIELARQAASQAKRLFPQWVVEIEQGAKHKASGKADVTVATYQTLLQPDRLAKFDPCRLKAIIVDEAHHAAARSYRRLLSRFHRAVKHPDQDFTPEGLTHTIPIIGFSATFSRHDGLALGSVFERIVYHRDFLDMIKEQWLCNVRFTCVRANIDLKDVTINARTGDFNATSLAHIVNTDTVNNLVVRSWLDRAATRKTTLVFCVNLAHVRDLTKKFREHGIDARYIYSGTPATERKALVASFKAGHFPILVNCAILTEGTDIPSIDCVVLARPTRSRNLFAQMIGRGMRQSPDTSKVDCQIIDFVESFTRVAGVVSTPTLFGLDPSVVINDDDIQTLEEHAAALIASENNDVPAPRSDSKHNVPSPTTVTFTDYEDPFSLVHQSSGAPHLSKLSRFAWVGCGGDVYVLECLGKGAIRIDPVDGDGGKPMPPFATSSLTRAAGTDRNYTAVFNPTVDIATAKALKMSPFLRGRKILNARSLDDAVRGCDTYAKDMVLKGPMAMGLLRSARWRKEPATEHQKAFIAKRWGKRKEKLEDMSDEAASHVEDAIDVMTKGQAANIITRLKHGAKGRYDKKAQADAKTARLLTKERKRQARENVQVGPLSVDEDRLLA